MVMRYATKTINIRPSIPRMSRKRGESWSTNKAGPDVTMAKKVSPIQSSIFSIQSNRRSQGQLYQQRTTEGKQHPGRPQETCTQMLTTSVGRDGGVREELVAGMIKRHLDASSSISIFKTGVLFYSDPGHPKVSFTRSPGGRGVLGIAGAGLR